MTGYDTFKVEASNLYSVVILRQDGGIDVVPPMPHESAEAIYNDLSRMYWNLGDFETQIILNHTPNVQNRPDSTKLENVGNGWAGYRVYVGIA